MYLLLFMIGFELDLKEMMKKSEFILKGSVGIILLEALFGGILLHLVFECDWTLSFLIALSFATVGEAILLPILDEFKIINTKLGQTIIGIGTLDDLIEVFTLVLLVGLVGSRLHTPLDLGIVLISLIILFLLTLAFTRLKKKSEKFKIFEIETLFLFSIFVVFLFLGIGEYAESSALAALLAGISLKSFIPSTRLKLIEDEIRSICYGFFAPIFFLWVGLSMNITYLTSYPSLILLVVFVSGLGKLLGSIIVGKNYLGLKQSVLLGIGLCARFSTSIVIIKILYENQIITSGLYSVLVASTLVFTFGIPILFSNLLARWFRK